MAAIKTQAPPEFLTLPAAARRSGIGLRQLRRARDHGELDVFEVGGWSRVRWLSVLAWIERQRVDVDGLTKRRVGEALKREGRSEAL